MESGIANYIADPTGRPIDARTDTGKHSACREHVHVGRQHHD
jgi:hypothetical protein